MSARLIVMQNLCHDVKSIVISGKGATGDEYRTRRAAEREGRRTRRRREREKKGDSNHHDGMSTDDEESQSEIQLMQSELGECPLLHFSLHCCDILLFSYD